MASTTASTPAGTNTTGDTRARRWARQWKRLMTLTEQRPVVAAAIRNLQSTRPAANATAAPSSGQSTAPSSQPPQSASISLSATALPTAASTSAPAISSTARSALDDAVDDLWSVIIQPALEDITRSQPARLYLKVASTSPHAKVSCEDGTTLAGVTVRFGGEEVVIADLCTALIWFVGATLKPTEVEEDVAVLLLALNWTFLLVSGADRKKLPACISALRWANSPAPVLFGTSQCWGASTVGNRLSTEVKTALQRLREGEALAAFGRAKFKLLKTSENIALRTGVCVTPSIGTRSGLYTFGNCAEWLIFLWLLGALDKPSLKAALKNKTARFVTLDAKSFLSAQRTFVNKVRACPDHQLVDFMKKVLDDVTGLAKPACWRCRLAMSFILMRAVAVDGLFAVQQRANKSWEDWSTWSEAVWRSWFDNKRTRADEWQS